MRLAQLYVRTAVVAALPLVACACQTAQKPATLLPPGKAPALHAAVTPTQVAATSTTPAKTVPPPTEDAQPEKAASVESATAPDPAAAPSHDRVADLIARAEKKYQLGLANHKAGKMDEARQNFDDALDALLSSHLDIRSDERLQEEFDRIVQGVNELYPVGTAAETDAQQQQKSEPAPIDETNGLTPAPDAGVKAKAQAEIKNMHSDLA